MSDSPLQLGLLGAGIAHSLSPWIHGQAALRAGVNLEYHLLETTPEQLPERLKQLRHAGFAGLNLTRPLKSAVLPLLEDLTPLASRAGSVNLLVPGQRGWRGTSSDGAGFLEPLRVRGLEPTRVRLLGAGGAARAVAHALRARWPQVELELSARNPRAARELAQSLPGPAVCHVSHDQLPGRPLDLLVNATPVGMAGEAAQEVPFPLAGLRDVRCVHELVSVPWNTPLIKAARKAGCTVIGGVEMLVAQAAPAFSLWTGSDFPLAALTRLARLRVALAGKLARPVVLVGLMGSGKSTLAPLLGSALGLKWLDTDTVLEQRLGAPIAELFTRLGEARFREEERRAFVECLHPDGPAIIATGGGLAAQPGFLGEFAARAYFAHLHGEPELLWQRAGLQPLSRRPLLAAGGFAALDALYGQRLPHYLDAEFQLELRAGEAVPETMDRLLDVLETPLLESVC
ncbi:MAG: hypothetical protein KC518_06990 [Candidatus Cloacimonetes bacterium]|nr:hypothetical protein [Candidatus Cloacimonadota bacterium]